MTRVIILLTIAAAGAISGSAYATRTTPRIPVGSSVRSTEFEVLRVLSLVPGLWVSLYAVSESVGQSPATCVFAIANHPSIEMRGLGADRFYRIRR